MLQSTKSAVAVISTRSRVRHRRRELISSVVCHSVVHPARALTLLEPSSDGFPKVAGGAEGPDGGRSSRGEGPLQRMIWALVWPSAVRRAT